MGKVLIAAAVVVTAAAVVGGARVWASQDVETPAYKVEAAQGAFEVRQYPAMVAAQVDRQGDRGAAVRAAFSPLAGYIFAKARPSRRSLMTTDGPCPLSCPRGGPWRICRRPQAT